jgi:uncharacterized protein YabE (DUF348 family)
MVQGEAYAIRTRARTIGDLLQEQGITLRADDAVEPAVDAPLRANLIVRVERARPVTLNVDGQVFVVSTVLTNPAEILSSMGVEIDAADRVIVDGTVAAVDRLPSWPVPVNSLTVRRAVAVQVQDGTEVRTLVTTSATVGEALYDAGIVLYLADSVSPDVNAPVIPQQMITIRRSSPVTIHVDGKRIPTRLRGVTVGDALASAGIALLGLDYAVPREDAALVPGMTIRVIRVQEQLIVEETELAFETTWQADATRELDQQQVMQVGQSGLQRTVTRVRFENGIEVEREAAERTVVREPVNRVILYGTNVVIRSVNTADGPREYWRRVRMYATSYHPAALGGDDTTATGQRLQTGIVASDPGVIPYGAQVYVDGYGVGLMADTGGPRRFPLWIDLGYSDADFRPWSRYVDVYFLTPVPSEIDYILPR